MPILIIVGIGLLIFGAFVLLKFPDRPGGKIGFGKLEVSSVGAGLPLIFLGVICLIIYSDNRSFEFWPSPKNSIKQGTSKFKNCFAEYSDEISEDRIKTLETGVQDVDLIGPQQSKQEPAGIIFTENRKPVGAIRFSFYENNEIFKIESIVDSECQPIAEYTNQSRSGDKRVLQNWDTVEMQIGDSAYALRLGYDGGVISANYFRKISP